MWALALLLACGRSAEPAADPDADDDGVDAPDDCDDADARTHPGAPELGDGVDRDCDGRAPPPPLDLTGTESDAGFGHAVALRGADLLVGEPFAAPGAAGAALPAGRVSIVDAGGVEAWIGAYGAARGASIAVLADGAALVGEPGASAVRTPEGSLVLAASGAGRALTARGMEWAARAEGGAIRSDGTRVALGRAADALAFLPDGTLVAGLAEGDVAVVVGEARVLRASPADGAGRALAVGDADADGDMDLLVGAPEAGRVYLLDPSALPASLADAPFIEAEGGRFGAALAVHEPGDWFVGAPVAGPAAEGAVYRVRRGVASPFLQGDAPGAQLGFSLAAADDALAIGAPGAAGTPGRALRVLP
jgi:hypothetical protein